MRGYSVIRICSSLQQHANATHW